MELLKLLLDVSLIFIAIKAATAGYDWPEELQYRLDKSGMQLIQHNINLVPCLNENNYNHLRMSKYMKSYIDKQRAIGEFVFYGESKMLFHDNNKYPNINLHVLNLKIDEDEAKIIYKVDGIDQEVFHLPFFYYDDKLNINLKDLDVEFIHTYWLILKFVGRIADYTGNFFKTSYINNKGEEKWMIVAGSFRGPGAREIFPCWDEPNIRTNFTISTQHHKNYTAISNTKRLWSVYDYYTDMSWSLFETTDKISAHHVAVVWSELENLPNTSVRCRQGVEEYIKFALEVVENATLYLKHMFQDAKFPSKVNHIVIPNFRDEGLESWGLVLYSEAAVIYDEKLDVPARKFEIARMVARKMFHQYFGNLVSQTGWSYLWLNEGIATFLAMEIVKEFVHPNLMDLLAVQFQHESLRLNDYYKMPLVSKAFTPEEIDSLFSFTYYVKAPVFIRSILQSLSINEIKTGLNRYLTTYQLRSIDTSSSTTEQFFNALQEAVEELRALNVNLTKRLYHWTIQERYPMVQVTRESDGSEDKVTLLQRNFNESYPADLYIRVTYTTQSNFNIRKTGWLSPQKPVLRFTPVNKYDWIIVNVQQAGNYRVNYDKENWQILIEYLNSKEYSNIHVLNRAQIIDDAYYFLLNNRFDYSLFKSLTYYLSKERNYVAWYPMFKIMEELSVFFPFRESTEIKEHFQKILESVLKDIGYINRVKEDVFTECLRQEAAKWACNLNSLECTNNAFLKLLSRHEKSILPGWKDWTYCKGLMSANDTFRNEVLRIEEFDINLIKFLACTKNHTIIIGYLDLLKSGYFTEAQHRITVFHSIIARHAKNDIVLDYILDNFANVVPREIKAFVALTDIINHVYSEKHINKISIFLEDAKFSIYFPNKFDWYVYTKTEQRADEIDNHKDYFTSFLNTRKIMV